MRHHRKGILIRNSSPNEASRGHDKTYGKIAEIAEILETPWDFTKGNDFEMICIWLYRWKSFPIAFLGVVHF